MVSVCLPSDVLLQHLPSYVGFSYLGRGVSLHGCSGKAQLLLLTLDESPLLTLNVGLLLSALVCPHNHCSLDMGLLLSSIMLKILQARLQQYVNRELPDVQAGFRKGRGTRDQIVKKQAALSGINGGPESTSEEVIWVRREDFAPSRKLNTEI